MDAIRTITRAKVTRDTLSMVMTGFVLFLISFSLSLFVSLTDARRSYARDAAESKTPVARGLLDEMQVQNTAHNIYSAEALANRRNCALHSHGAYEFFSATISQIAILLLSRMGVDQVRRKKGENREKEGKKDCLTVCFEGFASRSASGD